MHYDLSQWPEIDLAQVRAAFRQVPLEAYPELSGYDRGGIHAGLAGQGGLFLASDMARRLALRPGQRVLDLGCGSGATAFFLARHFGVTVYAVDASLPDELSVQAAALGATGRVIPVKSDARLLPFKPGEFDAVFSMNSFFYFGTDDLYPPYLMAFLKAGGSLVIGCPCYTREISPDIPQELLIEFPACLAVHSPNWWRNHFEKSRSAVVLESALHPRGVEFWEDRVRFLLEEQAPRAMPDWKRDMVYAMIRMLNRDTEGRVSHFIMHARKPLPA